MKLLRIFLVRVRKDNALGLPCEILDRNKSHRVAPFVDLPFQIRDNSAHAHGGPRLHGLRRPQLGAGKGLDFLRILEQGMARDIEAQHCFFTRKLFHLSPLRHCLHVRLHIYFGSGARKQVRLTPAAVFLLILPIAGGCFHVLKQLRPVIVQRIESTGLNQAFCGLLVDKP